MRRREIRGDWGNHHEKLGLERISCVRQFMICDTAYASLDLASINPEMWSSQSNQASRIPDFSYLLISSILFPSSFPNSLLLVHNSTIFGEYKFKLSLSISPCHDHTLTLSTTYTEYCIHRRWFVFPSFS